MTDTPRSVLITTIGRRPDSVGFAEIADKLGVEHRPLVTGDADLSAVIAAEPLADGSALLVGTGNTEFDAAAAAALGVPLLIVADSADLAVDLAHEQAEAAGAVVAGHLIGDEVDAEHLHDAMAAAHATCEPFMSPDLFEHWLICKAREHRAHIVLPEGDDDRILQAAHQLLEKDVCDLTILGDVDAITARAKELNLDISKATLSDPLKDPKAEEFAQEFAKLRKAKGVTLEDARETMKDISYYATMMIHTGMADGMVSGAAHTTAHTIKPSLQIIKTSPGVNFVSSIFLMVMPGKLWAFGDCAVMPNPTAKELGEIAVVSARTAARFGVDPKVAMLSYSTGVSGAGPDVERAAAAVEAARAMDDSIPVDGPLQFDAAIDEGVAKKKAPDSPVAGHANVMVFPDLEAGNIAYKAVQRTAGALAVGPILQGLKKPVNDLSRGATVPDIVNTVAITAIQAGGN